MNQLIERLTIDIVTDDCGPTYTALDHIHQWVNENGLGQTIINSSSETLILLPVPEGTEPHKFYLKIMEAQRSTESRNTKKSK